MRLALKDDEIYAVLGYHAQEISKLGTIMDPTEDNQTKYKYHMDRFNYFYELILKMSPHPKAPKAEV